MGHSKNGFAEALILWYHQHGRLLPWRDTRDPYAIWLSEIMLQQTQVNTVKAYYAKFLTLFPTIQDLAQAPLEAVMKAWEGLGYYARCRNLHKTAQIITEQYQGRFPETLEAVEALPGIGRSTAGAILTFAYGQRHPLLDGNVKRVLSRIFKIEEDPALTAVQKTMWVASEALLEEADDSYAFNQGIMELGATVCLPQAPRCLLCPVQPFCEAYAFGMQQELPVKAKRKPVPHYDIAVGVIWNKENQVLIQQRPAEGLLGGLWEFPGGKQEPDETLETTVQREIAEELGIDIVVCEKIETVKHAYTHFKITLHAYRCVYQSGEPHPRAATAWKWVPVSELPQYAFPKANKTVLEGLLKTNGAL